MKAGLDSYVKEIVIICTKAVGVLVVFTKKLDDGEASCHVMENHAKH